ncbi:MAG: hypothetical protein SVS85_00520, partial [Candidatus Nanohaloarchaea archaeon]|nr:hypothetical protein [Candidatus Nanohaloarchaea archaeon]
WSESGMLFENLPANTSSRGSILVRPSDSVEAGTYTVSVSATKANRTNLDVEQLGIRVLKDRDVRKVSVVEMPRFLELEPGTTRDVSLLLENTGDYDLENVTVDVR